VFIFIGLGLITEFSGTVVKIYLTDKTILLIGAFAAVLAFYGQIVITWMFTKRYIEITLEMASFDQKQESKTHSKFGRFSMIFILGIFVNGIS
jgi:hypothetical protein